MITRFFKKKSVKTPKKKVIQKTARAEVIPAKKILTAEGWKRLMMRKKGKGKK